MIFMVNGTTQLTLTCEFYLTVSPLYIMHGNDKNQELLAKLGKHKSSGDL